jgi:predicted ATP-dependent serine protease
VDLCVAASLLSSYKDINIGKHAAFFGEIVSPARYEKLSIWTRESRNAFASVFGNILPERRGVQTGLKSFRSGIEGVLRTYSITWLQHIALYA